jgi:hypothetical protein
MSSQKILEGSTNTISLQELEDGVMHLDLQDGMTIDLFAQQVCHASHSVQQEKNRLKMRCDLAGSMIYKQTWKQKVTPAGMLYWAHTASVPYINAKGYTGFPINWPTVTTQDNPQIAGQGKAMDHPKRGTTLGGAARSVAWATPLASDSRGSAGVGKKELPNQVKWIGNNQEEFTDQTKNTGSSRLNPRFSLWLMGFPIEWAYCAERVTLSSLK